MKATLLFVMIMALCMVMIPMIAVHFDPLPAALPVQQSVTGAPYSDVIMDGYTPEEPGYDEVFESQMAARALYGNPGADNTQTLPAPEQDGVESFKILNESTGEVETVPLRDFVRGAVAAEMPASFHTEALKAQAVAAHTFAVHSHLEQLENPDPLLKGADFKADPQKMKVYITEAAARDFYGADSELYWTKICEAADSVLDYLLVYEDEPIVAAYHAISSGRTEDAANVWTGSAPYLLSVSSESDRLAPGFESTATFTEAEVRTLLEAQYPGIQLGEGSWFQKPARADSGYVSAVQVGSLSIPGKELRQIFGLRSHDFEIDYEDGNYIFTVTGYGHGVGLSQYGADFLARQGRDFNEILNTYYSGVSIEKDPE